MGLLRHSEKDAWLVGVAFGQGFAAICLCAWAAGGTAPSRLLAGGFIALGLWWGSNTISHNHVHNPLFRSRRLNRWYSAWLTLVLGVPQSYWRARHLWHHAGEPEGRRPRVFATAHLGDWALLGTFWAALALAEPAALGAYVPGVIAGLGLCALQGHFEHAGAAASERKGLSHYGWLYNRLCLNDGYHAEHHLWPTAHWTRLPKFAPAMATGAKAPASSPWPPVMRWLTPLSQVLATAQATLQANLLDALERASLHSPALLEVMVERHSRALRALLAGAGGFTPRRVLVVGGGLFPRTVLALRRVVPLAEVIVVDASPGNLRLARRQLASRDPSALARVHFVEGTFPGWKADGCDLVVLPLAFRGDRASLYRRPPAAALAVHDWIWRRRGAASAVVSAFLLKRINLILEPVQDPVNDGR